MKKIYCRNCQYLVRLVTQCDYECAHPDNTIKIEKDDFYQHYEYFKCTNHPSELNRDNDCTWFVSIRESKA